MERPARSHEPGFNPVVDTPEWRRAQRNRLLDFAKDLEAEHGPVPPELRAEVQAKLDSLDP